MWNDENGLGREIASLYLLNRKDKITSTEENLHGRLNGSPHYLEYKKKVVSAKHFHQYPYSIFHEINQNVELMNFTNRCWPKQTVDRNGRDKGWTILRHYAASCDVLTERVKPLQEVKFL